MLMTKFKHRETWAYYNNNNNALLPLLPYLQYIIKYGSVYNKKEGITASQE